MPDNEVDNVSVGLEATGADKTTKSLKQVTKATDEFYNTAIRLKKEVEGTASSVGDLNTQVRGAEGAFGVADLALSQFAITASSVFRRALSDFGAFEQGIVNITKVIDTTKLGPDLTQATDSLGSSILELGKRIPVTNAGLVTIGQNLGQLGFFARSTAETLQTDIIQNIELVAKVSSALGVSADAAGTSFGVMRNIFVDTSASTVEVTDKLSRFSDVINELQNNTAATADFLFDFNQRVGATAQTLGIGFEQVSAFGAAVAQLGRTSEVGGTALQSFFVAATQKAEVFAQALNLTTDEFSRQFNLAPYETLVRFLTKLNQLTPEYRANLIGQVTDSQRAVSVINGIASNIGLLTNSLELANKAYKEGTSVTQEFERTSATLNASLTKLGNAVSSAFIQGFATIATVFQPLIDGVVAFTTTFPTLTAAVAATATVTAGFVAVAAGIAILAPKIKLGIDALGKGYEFLSGKVDASIEAIRLQNSGLGQVTTAAEVNTASIEQAALAQQKLQGSLTATNQALGAQLDTFGRLNARALQPTGGASALRAELDREAETIAREQVKAQLRSDVASGLTGDALKRQRAELENNNSVVDRMVLNKEKERNIVRDIVSAERQRAAEIERQVSGQVKLNNFAERAVTFRNARVDRNTVQEFPAAGDIGRDPAATIRLTRDATAVAQRYNISIKEANTLLETQAEAATRATTRVRGLSSAFNKVSIGVGILGAVAAPIFGENAAIVSGIGFALPLLSQYIVAVGSVGKALSRLAVLSIQGAAAIGGLVFAFQSLRKFSTETVGIDKLVNDVNNGTVRATEAMDELIRKQRELGQAGLWDTLINRASQYSNAVQEASELVALDVQAEVRLFKLRTDGYKDIADGTRQATAVAREGAKAINQVVSASIRAGKPLTEVTELIQSLESGDTKEIFDLQKLGLTADQVQAIARSVDESRVARGLTANTESTINRLLASQAGAVDAQFKANETLARVEALRLKINKDIFAEQENIVAEALKATEAFRSVASLEFDRALKVDETARAFESLTLSLRDQLNSVKQTISQYGVIVGDVLQGTAEVVFSTRNVSAQQRDSAEKDIRVLTALTRSLTDAESGRAQALAVIANQELPIVTQLREASLEYERFIREAKDTQALEEVTAQISRALNVGANPTEYAQLLARRIAITKKALEAESKAINGRYLRELDFLTKIGASAENVALARSKYELEIAQNVQARINLERVAAREFEENILERLLQARQISAEYRTVRDEFGRPLEAVNSIVELVQQAKQLLSLGLSQKQVQFAINGIIQEQIRIIKDANLSQLDAANKLLDLERKRTKEKEEQRLAARATAENELLAAQQAVRQNNNERNRAALRVAEANAKVQLQIAQIERDREDTVSRISEKEQADIAANRTRNAGNLEALKAEEARIKAGAERQRQAAALAALESETTLELQRQFESAKLAGDLRTQAGREALRQEQERTLLAARQEAERINAGVGEGDFDPAVQRAKEIQTANEGVRDASLQVNAAIESQRALTDQLNNSLTSQGLIIQSVVDANGNIVASMERQLSLAQQLRGILITPEQSAQNALPGELINQQRNIAAQVGAAVPEVDLSAITSAATGATNTVGAAGTALSASAGQLAETFSELGENISNSLGEVSGSLETLQGTVNEINNRLAEIEQTSNRARRTL